MSDVISADAIFDPPPVGQIGTIESSNRSAGVCKRYREDFEDAPIEPIGMPGM